MLYRSGRLLLSRGGGGHPHKLALSRIPRQDAHLLGDRYLLELPLFFCVVAGCPAVAPLPFLLVSLPSPPLSRSST
jgi:hypothetical protein